jgi:hypothetical protein
VPAMVVRAASYSASPGRMAMWSMVMRATLGAQAHLNTSV